MRGARTNYRLPRGDGIGGERVEEEGSGKESEGEDCHHSMGETHEKSQETRRVNQLCCPRLTSDEVRTNADLSFSATAAAASDLEKVAASERTRRHSHVSTLTSFIFASYRVATFSDSAELFARSFHVLLTEVKYLRRGGWRAT